MGKCIEMRKYETFVRGGKFRTFGNARDVYFFVSAGELVV